MALSDRKKYSRRISTHFLYRLKNPYDSLVHNVQHLSVGYVSNAAALPEKLLLQALRNIKGLKSFTWCTWLPIPVGVLDCLQKVHPSAHLMVLAHERNDLPLDVPLISSPQLHTLDVRLSVMYTKTVPKFPYANGYRGYRGKSELNYLKTLIIKGGNLKTLCLKFEEIKHGSKAANNRLKDFGPAVYDPITFKFKKNEMLPALEELTLRTMFKGDGDRTTPLKAWITHQDWTKLRKLDLRLNESKEMIQSLAGAVPRLETLIMKVDESPPYHQTLSIYEEFLHSVPELTSLSVRGGQAWSQGVLQIIFRTVSSQLTCLELEMGWDLEAWRRAHFEGLLEHCAKLERLDLKIYEQCYAIRAEWSTAEAELPAKIKVAQLVQYSSQSLPTEFVYRHSHNLRGQRSKGAHALSRFCRIVSTRPYRQSNTNIDKI